MNKLCPRLIGTVILQFIICLSLNAQKEMMYVVSQLDLTQEEVVKRLNTLPRSAEEDSLDNIIVVLGFGIRKEEQFEHLARNIETLQEVYKKVYLIPGEEEWTALKASGIASLDNYLEDKFDSDILIPDNACGELETKEVGKETVIATMDSHWYLQNWKEDKFINKGCETRDRDIFWLYFMDELSGHKDRVVFLFTYHPPVRYDRLAGHFPASSHFLPLPVMGTFVHILAAYTRGHGYPTHPIYKDYTSRIISAIELEPNVISISAEGAYQMDLHREERYFINVNSKEANDYIARKKVDWSHDRPAYLKIFVDDLHAHIAWHAYETHDKLFDRTYTIDTAIKDTISHRNFLLDDLDATTYRAPILYPNEIPDLNDAFFGSLNTEIYFEEVEAPILDLSKVNGGLEAVKIGGGRQTKSVRFEDSEGIEYVARTIQKTPAQLIPPPYDVSFAKQMVSYYFTGAHPYGFLMSNYLEKKLGLYHTRPELRFLPTQERLQPYNDEVGNKMVLFRTRADDDRESFYNFAHSEELISSDDLFDEYLENDAQPHQELFLKTRLLDLLINDWDRHRDQFRWAKDPDDEDEVKTYFPIPRDRDQAFSNYNGLFMNLANTYVPILFQFQPFDDELSFREVNWAHYISSYIDNMFLTSMSREQWDKTTRDFINGLDDETLEKTVAQLPEEIPEPHKKELLHNLKTRVKDFENTSDMYYRVINKKAYVQGSEKTDSIVITYSRHNTEVNILTTDDDDKVFTKFHKVFDPKVTDEIWVYSMGDDDIILVKGDKRNKIISRLTGGYGDDRYMVPRHLKESAIIYDINEENEIPPHARSVVSDNKELITLNKTDFKKNYGFLIPTIAYNSDDGFFLGTNYRYYDHEFKSSWTHDFSASISTKRTASAFAYHTLFSSKLNQTDKYIDLEYFGPHYELNFHGIGNGISINTELPDEYYFVRTKTTNFEIGLMHHLRHISVVKAGLNITRVKLDDVPDRFVSFSDEVDDQVFRSQFYAGISLRYELDNFDSRFKPQNGVSIDGGLRARKHLYIGDKDHIIFDGSVTILKSIGVHERFVLGSKVGFSHIMGDSYFYHMPTLGGTDKLRGFRRERFYGHTAFFHNNNLHVHILQRRPDNNLTHSLGLSFYFDHGRVWSEKNNADTWHYNYGAGIFFAPLDVIVISGGLFRSKEESQVRVGIGWLI